MSYFVAKKSYKNYKNSPALLKIYDKIKFNLEKKLQLLSYLKHDGVHFLPDLLISHLSIFF